MSEPTSMGDPVAVILARMEVKLDNALTEQSRHSTIIERHDQTLGEHGNRLTALETRDQADDTHHSQTVSARAAFWTACGSIILLLSVLVTLWVQHR